jgi:MFS family permease
MGPTFAQRNGLSDSEISAFLGLPILGALALQWPLGMLSDHVSRRPVMLASCLAAGAASLGLTFAAQESPPLLFALSFLLGGFSIPMSPLAVAHVNDHIEADELIAAASSLVLLYGAGAAIGPFAASLAIGRLGPPGLFGFTAAVLFALAGFALFRMVKRRPLARGLRDRFVGVPSTTHAHLPLHRHSTGRPPGEAAPG